MRKVNLPRQSYLGLALAFAQVTLAASQPISREALDRAKSELHRAVEAEELAGGSLLVVQAGDVACFEVVGVRDIEDQTPLKTNTIMRIYSMTKPITSVAAMILFEQGKFALDDPISMYIPAFAATTVVVEEGDLTRIVPANRQLTIRDVMRHTTGYSYGGGPPKVGEYYAQEGMLYRPPHAMMPPAMTIQVAAEALARIPALHQPGARFSYGFNTDLLGRLIEVWSGKPLDEFLRDTVLTPLDMEDTGFSVPAEKRERFASCHTVKAGKLGIADKAADSPFNQGFEFLSGGGGLVSTMQDYAHFCQMLVEGGAFRGKRLLKEETIALMFTDQLNGVGGPFRFGLGFAIREVKIGAEDQRHTVPEYYWAGYASTDFRLVPEERLFQIFMRQQVPSSHQLASKLFAIIYEGVQ